VAYPSGRQPGLPASRRDPGAMCGPSPRGDQSDVRSVSVSRTTRRAYIFRGLLHCACTRLCVRGETRRSSKYSTRVVTDGCLLGRGFPAKPGEPDLLDMRVMQPLGVSGHRVRGCRQAGRRRRHCAGMRSRPSMSFRPDRRGRVVGQSRALLRRYRSFERLYGRLQIGYPGRVKNRIAKKLA
jgi:hypothetical protein